ncbi:MAG TPA: CPBP family intramembrane glutamic endopeptidase, partial [Candidatus Polarisedimenticolaceae bacterium]|nr:CPBP family intramembrane glutamic endopeptidase [Candidatus Polarisedimenticolaceae bacterium]
FDAGVAAASARGFLVGLLAGGVLALAVRLLQAAAGAGVALQPRGFFFYTLNTASPAATSLLFFFGVALAEELGYRWFGGTWIERLTGRRWLAIVIPALIYGLTHARLEFLPPMEPFWARPLALGLVGIVWGWAFFRFDALTVVLSHFTADLFIFNWPRLASGEIAPLAGSLATLAVPLLPALGWSLRAAVGAKNRPPPSGLRV